MKWLNYWLPTLLWMGTIFFLSSRTSVKVSDTFIFQFLFFKSLHVIEYAMLYALVYRSLKNTTALIDWKIRVQAFLISLVYAVSDEVHQVFVVTREGTVRDIFIDTIGISLAFYYLWKLLPKAPLRLKKWARVLGFI